MLRPDIVTPHVQADSSGPPYAMATPRRGLYHCLMRRYTCSIDRSHSCSCCILDGFGVKTR